MFRAVLDSIEVEQDPIEEVSEAGLILKTKITQGDRGWSRVGTVKSLGDVVKAQLPELKVGSRILFRRYGGEEVDHGDKKYTRFISVVDVLAIEEENNNV